MSEKSSGNMVQTASASKRGRLEFLLDCRQFELGFCKLGSQMYDEILKEIKFIQRQIFMLKN